MLAAAGTDEKDFHGRTFPKEVTGFKRAFLYHL